MKSSLLLPLLVVALPTVANAMAADGRPVRNSFINRPVGGTADLLAHVRASRTVADRYQRHFAMDRTTLLRFLGGLHRGRLAKAGIYTIYSVPQGGRLKMHVGRIRKGEPMFFNRAGQPTLVVKCGNPIVLGPSRAQNGNPVALAPQEDGTTRSLGIVASASEAEGETPVAMEPKVPEAAVAEVMSEGSVPAAFEPSVIAVSSPGNGAASFLASLTFLAPFAAVLPPDVEAQTKIVPVPEPLSVIALAAGFGSLARRRRRP